MNTNYEETFRKIKLVTKSDAQTEQILKALGITRPTPPKPPSKREQYENTYAYGELARKYNIQNETGLWQIYGEDDNPDFGGNHHEPLLETVEGKLNDVINYAVNLPRFWQWGGGGRITKITTKKI
jgi:hypothetical protein